MKKRAGKESSKFNFVDFEIDEEINAVFVRQWTKVGAWKKNAFEFLEIGKKNTFHLWESAVLRTLFYGVPLGSVVKICYRGKGESEGSKYKIHLWEIDIIDIGTTITRKVEQTSKTNLPEL